MASAPITVGHPPRYATPVAPASPSPTPNSPPAADKTTASTRNWARMSRLARPDAPADADLAGPLGDGRQHDVHDPDAADRERHRGDAGEQYGHDALGLGARLRTLVGAAD